MNTAEKLQAVIDGRLASALGLLEEMVAINSFTRNRAGVDRLGRFTAESFAGLGFTADSVPSVNPDYGDHLVLTRRGRSARTIGLISHLDTVFPPDEEIRNNFVWRQEGDRLYGPGTLDIKGGTVMIHLVLSALKEASPAEFQDTTWIILCNSSEEVLSHDFGALCLKRLGKDTIAALVFEGEGGTEKNRAVVVARKGRATFDVRVEGRGAHAGSHHERGANAVVQVADTILKIAAVNDYSKERTVNVGSVAGGTVVNRVPHLAAAEVEMRTFTPEAHREGVEAIMALNGKAAVRSAEDGHPCNVVIQVASQTPPWPRNAATDRLFELWKKAGEEIGFPIGREERGGISDGNYLCETIPTLDGLGPFGDNAHCSETSADGSKQPEYLDVTSVAPKARLNALAILNLLRQPPV